MLALSVKLYLAYRVTLATFLSMPCYEHGRKVACDESPGSFNYAMRHADACGGNWQYADPTYSHGQKYTWSCAGDNERD